jgi:hypothetical protein
MYSNSRRLQQTVGTLTTVGLLGCVMLQSSHKLQVVVVCEEALPRITYSARTVDVGPLTEHLATEMVKEAQPDVSVVSPVTPCHAHCSVFVITYMGMLG